MNELTQPLKITDQAHYDSLQEAGVSPLSIADTPPVPVRPARSTAQITKAIAGVMREVDVVAKRGVNQFHRYKYASMQDILQQITPLLGKHGLAIFQDEVERSMFDQEGVIAVKYAFEVAHESGETWPRLLHQTGVSRCRDSKGGWDDKSLNKCHTAARKYFLLSLFQIPTGDEEDDADKGGSNGEQKLKSVYASKPIAAEIKAAFLACKSIDQLFALGDEKAPIIGTLNVLCQDDIRETFATHRKNLRIDGKYHGQPASEHTETTDPDTGEIADQVIWTEDGERPATAADMPDPLDIPDSLKRLTPKEEALWLDLLRSVAAAAPDVQAMMDLQSEHMGATMQRKVSPTAWLEAVTIFRERVQWLTANPVFDAETWLAGDLAGALSGAETAEQLAKVKDRMLIPRKDELSPDQWRAAVKMYRERLDAIDPQNGLAGG
jgi:hypothetical protein